MRMQRKLSGDALKRQLREQLEAAADLRERPALAFCWRPGGFSGEMGRDRSGRLCARLNLAALSRGAVRTPGGQAFYVQFLCGYLAARARMQEQAAETAGTYLSGLARLEELYLRQTRRWVPFSLPGLDWGRSRGRPSALGASGILCALFAYEETVRRSGQLLSPEEAGALAQVMEDVRLLSELPEIGYYGTDLPRSSVVWTVSRAGELLERCPACAEASALRALCGPDGQLCTPRQLLDGEAGTDPLHTGIALRLLAVSDGGTRALSEAFDRSPKLLETALEYRERSVNLFSACSAAPSPLLRDDLAAVNRTIPGVNEALDACGVPARSGTIRPMGI